MEIDSYSYVDFDLDRAKANNSASANKPKIARRKFAVPPVKVACLEW